MQKGRTGMLSPFLPKFMKFTEVTARKSARNPTKLNKAAGELQGKLPKSCHRYRGRLEKTRENTPHKQHTTQSSKLKQKTHHQTNIIAKKNIPLQLKTNDLALSFQSLPGDVTSVSLFLEL
jgi:hypothetical protein